MINWKTIIGLSLFEVSGVEFLMLKDHYHPGKMTAYLLKMEGLFILTILLGIWLVIKGLRKTGTVTQSNTVNRTLYSVEDDSPLAKGPGTHSS
jgi:heme A synthase